MLEITLTWVSGYRRSHRGRNNAPFIRSITHAPDQTYIRLQHLHCLFDLAISPPFWIIAWIETIFMEFRGPKALVNLHGRRQNIVLESRLRVGFFYRKTGERAAERNVCSEDRTAGCGNTLVFRDDLFSSQTTRSCSASALTGLALLQTF